jgi:lysophospholipase L1-like esterase
MGYQFITVALFPLLVYQGLKVRRKTPRLPEPPGNREGFAGNGPELRLLIIGDSAAAGVGALHQNKALSGQLVSALSQDFTVRWKLVAKTGNKIHDVLAQLENATKEKYDVVITSVGVNDVTGGTSGTAWLVSHERLIKIIKSKHEAEHIIISSVPPMHLFPALPQPLRWYIGMRADRLNDSLKSFVAKHTGCELASLSFPVEMKNMAPDGFHPGPLAYTLWAEHLAKMIRSRISRNTSQPRHRSPP